MTSRPATCRAVAPRSRDRHASSRCLPSRRWHRPAVPGACLDSSSWKVRTSCPRSSGSIGSDPDQGLVFSLDRKHNVVGTRSRDPPGPHLHRAGALRRRGPRRIALHHRHRPGRHSAGAPHAGALPLQAPGDPAGAERHDVRRLLARIGGKKPALEVLGPDQAPTTTPFEAGEMSESFWGDLVAVAGDGGVTVYQIQGKEKPRTLDVDGAKAAMFSPSGHRLYVVREDRAAGHLRPLLLGQLEEIDLPGPAVGLRGDLYGQWVLIRPARATRPGCSTSGGDGWSGPRRRTGRAACRRSCRPTRC